MPELFVNGKDAVMVALQELEVHGGGALLAVFDAAAYHLFDVLHFKSPGMEGILNPRRVHSPMLASQQTFP